MPTYEYKCTNCGKDFEYQHSMSAEPMSVCEACGGKLERLISRSAFQLKGAGWYKDGYGSRKPGDRKEPLPPEMSKGLSLARNQEPTAEKPAATPAVSSGDSGSGGASSGGASSGSSGGDGGAGSGRSSSGGSSSGGSGSGGSGGSTPAAGA
jgi:putative FmdB family regulatory protein